MNLLDRLLGLVGLSRTTRTRAHGQRGFNAASSDRLTKNHWGSATSSSINQDLISELETTRNRIRFERQNNGILEGMVKSNALDVVGPDGPRLQIATADTAWAAAAERIWNDWAAMPDIAGRLSLADFLTLDVRMDWDCGESFKLEVTDPTARGPVKLRLQDIHPRRIETPVGSPMGDLLDTTLGVRRARTGRPISYYVREDRDTEFGQYIGLVYTEVRADNVIHDFAIDEPGQVRGVPALAACLQVVAQLRDWDRDVQQSMRMAAMLGMLLTCDSAPGQAAIELNGSVDLAAGTATALPPGYDAKQIEPAQPGQKYNDFRNAKLAEIGRPAAMPLMMVNLDSSDHNYSSARFDSQTYDRTVQARRGRMRRRTLDRLVGKVIQEATLAGVLKPRPRDATYNWIWQPRPHVDPVKEGVAHNMRIENGTLSKSEVCALNGNDWDTVEQATAREQARSDSRTLERIAAINAQITAAKLKDPTLTVTWQQVLAALGAVSNPAAYLKAATGAAVADAVADQPPQQDNPDA